MTVLYITEQGAVVTKRGDRLRVLKEDRLLLDVPCHEIESVLIFGNVQVTTQAIAELFDHGIELALLSSRGRLRGQLTSPMTKNIDLRIAQYDRHRDPEFILRLSRALVVGKITNGLTLLQRFMDDHPEIGFETDIEALRQSLKHSVTAPAIPELLGVEGAAGAVYFAAFGKMLRTDLPFSGRRRRPPTDPVNSLLSFGYTLLFNEVSSLLDGLGFDPYLGFFHRPDYGRPSLAADLIEEFRAPVVDRFTLRILNLGSFKAGDFQLHAPSGGVHLVPLAMKRYFAAYEDFLAEEFKDPETGERTTARRCFRRQGEKLAACLKQTGEYRPFVWQR
jgi:CRISPR-associated protein Cas1